MFSRIASHFRSGINPLYKLLAELKSRGHVICDLVSANVNENGIFYPQEVLEEILVGGARSSSVYCPDSFGRRDAREAISAYYGRRGAGIGPDAILLTPGTSIAYWYCFKLLADEGDEILCPRPSYPLFDFIANLSAVRLVPYDLDEEHSWTIDLERLDSCISTRTRALVLISPHNPTGHVISRQEMAGLAELAQRHQFALISDEVFSEFLFSRNDLPHPVGSPAPLVFTLNGFSKMFALPGIKLGWMAVSGQPERVRQAVGALELISDTFLPVNEISQAAVASIFRNGQGFLSSYVREIQNRWSEAEGLLQSCRNCSFERPEGGFYVTLRLKDLDEEQAALTLLREEHLLVHPGYFYDMAHQHLVLSFVKESSSLRDALFRMTRALDRMK